jgi:hypothetical protein
MPSSELAKIIALGLAISAAITGTFILFILLTHAVGVI